MPSSGSQSTVIFCSAHPEGDSISGAEWLQALNILHCKLQSQMHNFKSALKIFSHLHVWWNDYKFKVKKKKKKTKYIILLVLNQRKWKMWVRWHLYRYHLMYVCLHVEPLYSLVNFVLLLRRMIFGCAGSGPTGRITVVWLPKDGINRWRNASEYKLVCDVVQTVQCKRDG